MTQFNRKALQPANKPKQSFLFWPVFISVLGYLSLASFNAFNWCEHGFGSMVKNLYVETNHPLSQLTERSRLTEAMMVAASQMLGRSIHSYQSELQSTVKTVAGHEFGKHIFGAKWSNDVGHLETKAEHVLVLFELTFWQLVIKAMALFESMGLIISMSILGAMDGLGKRYVRTIEGGRESTLLYHNAGKHFMALPMSVIALYIALPHFISGLVAALALSLSCFVYFNVRASCLKKYL